MPNKELLQRWLTALRSGQYRQGPGKLGGKDDKGAEYCCLGVLCDLVKDELVPGTNKKRFEWKFETIFQIGTAEGIYETGVLPHRIALQAGMTNIGGRFELTPETMEKFPKLVGTGYPVNGVTYQTLTHLNDHMGWTFTEIADLIESEPKGLFEPA